VYPHAGYVTVNISSPNTKNLRQLQGESELDGLLGPLKREQEALAQRHGRHVPLALKIAPDLDEAQIQVIADALRRHRIDAAIVTNTTLARGRRAPRPRRRGRRPFRRAAVRQIHRGAAARCRGASAARSR
jgi:dihydroorotate dehydrogenase